MPRATKPFQRSQQCSYHQKENIGWIPPWTCSLSSPNPIRNQRTGGSGKYKLIGKTRSRLVPRTCPAPEHEHLPGQLSSGKTASCRELVPPHARRCAAMWQLTRPTHSCWSRRRVFGRTPPKEDDQSSKRRKLNRHRSPQNSASAAEGPHEARRCAEDAEVLPPNQRQVCATPTHRFEHPTRTSGSMRHFLSEVAQVHERTFLRIAAQKNKRNQVLPGSTVFMRDETLLMVSTAQPDSLSTRTISILA